MHSPQTTNSPERLTRPLFRATLDAGSSVLWAVDLSVIGTAYGYTWRGWAADSQAAKRRAIEDGRRAWPGFGFCVRSVCQVSA